LQARVADAEKFAETFYDDGGLLFYRKKSRQQQDQSYK
jgi:hypothetical protein